MKNLKFFALLGALENNELPDFNKYLKQQHGKDEVALKVFEYVRKHFQSPEADKKLDMAYAYRKIFNAEISANPNSRKNMLNAFSDLHLWLKDFLLTERARHDSFESQVLWLIILQEKGLEDVFAREAEHFFEKAKALPVKGIKGSLKQATACYFYYQNLIQAREQPDLEAFQQCFDSLQACSESIRLKMAAEIANLKRFQSHASSAEVLKKPQKLPIKTVPLPVLYSEAYQLVVTENEIHFNRLKKMLIEQVETLEPSELHELLRYLYNYAALQIRIGKGVVYGKILHQLNIFGLEHQFFTEKNEMTVTGFSNIVNVACNVKDFSWVGKFINEKSILLPQEFRAETVSLSHAQVFFEKQQYAKTLKILEPLEFKDFYYVIRAKTLVLRSHYELKADSDKILDICGAFEAMLRRKRKSQMAIVVALLKFLSVFKMLVLQKNDKDTLLTLINDSPNLYFKEWLLAKMEDYDDKFGSSKGKW